MILESPITLVDIILRCLSIGQLMLLMGAVILIKKSWARVSLTLLMVCFISYVALTAPIANHEFGWLRRPLLLFTDLMPFALLLYMSVVLFPNKTYQPYFKIIFGILVSWCAFLIYFFLWSDISSFVHDVNHGIGLVLLVSIFVRCILGYVDDLNNSRRSIRLNLICIVSFYAVLLTIFEFLPSQYRNSWQFSLGNAVCVFLCVFSFALRAMKANLNTATSSTLPELPKKESKQLSQCETPTLIALNALMDKGIYKEQNLTVGQLASYLNIPAHHLRQLINSELGFNNFSHYLNYYRIPAVCEVLKDPNKKHIPILTIALEVGYGSIASFNRAFKQQIKITPSEYRCQI